VVGPRVERHGAARVDRAGYGLCVRATEAIKGRLQSLSLHFAGEEEEATLVVSPKQLFLMVDDKRAGQVACLAMVPGSRTVIGALQQVDTRFVYDLKENKLSFAPESCVQDTVPVV
jgi:aspartyl protease family protein